MKNYNLFLDPSLPIWAVFLENKRNLESLVSYYQEGISKDANFRFPLEKARYIKQAQRYIKVIEDGKSSHAPTFGKNNLLKPYNKIKDFFDKSFFTINRITKNPYQSGSYFEEVPEDVLGYICSFLKPADVKLIAEDIIED